MLKRVEYSSRELEQLKLLDAAMDDDDILDSDSLNFPENDNMDLTDGDEYHSLEEATSIILNANPLKNVNDRKQNNPSKSIFENDTEDENNLELRTTNLNKKRSININNTNTMTIPNKGGENEKNNNNKQTVININ